MKWFFYERKASVSKFTSPCASWEMFSGRHCCLEKSGILGDRLRQRSETRLTPPQKGLKSEIPGVSPRPGAESHGNFQVCACVLFQSQLFWRQHTCGMRSHPRPDPHRVCKSGGRGGRDARTGREYPPPTLQTRGINPLCVKANEREAAGRDHGVVMPLRRDDSACGGSWLALSCSAVGGRSRVDPSKAKL